MSPLKISALLSALVLAGCVVPPAQESAPQSTAPVQVECGVASPPGCREPAVPAALKEFEQKLKGEIQAANDLRQKAVDSMSRIMIAASCLVSRSTLASSMLRASSMESPEIFSSS